VLLVYLQVFTTILTLFVKTIPANSATIESSAFGTPLLAGPGAIAATIVFAKQVHHFRDALALGLAILGVHIVVWLTLRFSSVILKLLGRSGVTLVTRIAGLLLSAIAVQLAAGGIKAFVAS